MQTNVPKWLSIVVAVLLAVLLAFVTLNQAYSFINQLDIPSHENTISVTGEGKIASAPDTAIVSAGMNITGSSAADVQSKASQSLNKLTDFAKAQGIDKADITTSAFNLYPQQGYDPRTGAPSKETTYTATQQITVKVKGVDKDTQKLSSFLAGLTDNGANQINGINFTFDDANGIKDQARKDAIEQAKQKAQDLAATSGVTLGKVISVSEGSSGYGTPTPMMYDSLGSEAAKSVAPTIEPGNQDVTVTMTLIYEIK